MCVVCVCVWLCVCPQSFAGSANLNVKCHCSVQIAQKGAYEHMSDVVICIPLTQSACTVLADSSLHVLVFCMPRALCVPFSEKGMWAEGVQQGRVCVCVCGMCVGGMCVCVCV